MFIAEKGLIIGWQGRIAPGKNDTYMTAYTHGSSLILSKIDKDLLGKKQCEVEFKGEQKTATEADVGAIVLNSELYAFYEELKAMYPNIKFIKANQIPDFFMSGERGPDPAPTQKLAARFATSIRELLSKLKLGEKKKASIDDFFE